MAVGLGPLPSFYPVAGIRLGVASAGIKKPGRQDLVLFELSPGTQTAAVFTQNQFCAAPVQVAKAHMQAGMPRYLLINTGNANAGTGQRGLDDARQCCRVVAELTGVQPVEVLPFSTGVIGEPLPVQKIVDAAPALTESLDPGLWPSAAQGIMTTDTLPKGVSRKIEIDGQTLHISGISKGAGMICPNMATMLAFVATDAPIEADDLDHFLRNAVEASFNRITVDGDTSTNDACVLSATGKAGGKRIRPGTQAGDAFARELNAVMLELAQAIVRDGEGATKFVAVRVEEAGNTREALDVALTVAHSPLVKTALFASDPNWGRILAAVGRSPISDLNLNALRIFLGDVCIVRNGGRADDYTEERGQAVMDQSEISIRICLGDRGSVTETIWTSDLSHDYVTINAEYRT